MSDNNNSPVFPVSKLGEYTVIKDIAEGTFGKVKSEALDLSFPLFYVLKMSIF
jgi:hypothetical protein